MIDIIKDLWKRIQRSLTNKKDQEITSISIFIGLGVILICVSALMGSRIRKRVLFCNQNPVSIEGTFQDIGWSLGKYQIPKTRIILIQNENAKAFQTNANAYLTETNAETIEKTGKERADVNDPEIPAKNATHNKPKDSFWRIYLGWVNLRNAQRVMALYGSYYFGRNFILPYVRPFLPSVPYVGPFFFSSDNERIFTPASEAERITPTAPGPSTSSTTDRDQGARSIPDPGPSTSTSVSSSEPSRERLTIDFNAPISEHMETIRKEAEDLRGAADEWFGQVTGEKIQPEDYETLTKIVSDEFETNVTFWLRFLRRLFVFAKPGEDLSSISLSRTETHDPRLVKKEEMIGKTICQIKAEMDIYKVYKRGLKHLSLDTLFLNTLCRCVRLRSGNILTAIKTNLKDYCEN